MKQDWRLESLKSFDEFLEKRFPNSAEKSLLLNGDPRELARHSKGATPPSWLEQGPGIVKVARRDGERFDCATWLHKAKELPKEGFKGGVERPRNGKDAEPYEIIYFKVYKSQLPVVEKALETRWPDAE